MSWVACKAEDEVEIEGCSVEYVVTIIVTVVGSLSDACARAGVGVGAMFRARIRAGSDSPPPEISDARAPEGVIVLPWSANVSVVRAAFCAMKVVVCPSIYQLRAILAHYEHTFKAPFLKFG